MLIAVFCLTSYASADDSSFRLQSTLRIEGYLQGGNTENKERLPEYLVSNTLLSKPTFNLLSGSLSFANSKWKAEISGIMGSYADANLAHEKGILKHIGALWTSHDISEHTEILTGIYPSHIGLESPTGFDCINPSRSMVADNSPYYQSGIRIRHRIDNQTYTVHLLNGWQRSTIDSNGIVPAIGYDFSSQHGSVNYTISGFIGNVSHDSLDGLRIYQQCGATYQMTNEFQISGSIDIGTQNKNGISTWMISPLLMAQWNMSTHWKFNGRIEYYHDPDKMIAQAKNGLSGLGYSLGVDYLPFKQCLFRLEYRTMNDMRNGAYLENDASFFGLHVQWFISEYVIGDHSVNQ